MGGVSGSGSGSGSCGEVQEVQALTAASAVVVKASSPYLGLHANVVMRRRTRRIRVVAENAWRVWGGEVEA